MERKWIVWAAAFGAFALAACTSGPQYPNCRGDNDCQHSPHHEFCVRSHCQACRNDGDCPSGQTCTDNRCQQNIARNQCDDSHACPSGQDCMQGHCVPSQSSVGAYSDNGGQCTFPEIHFAFDDATLDAAARSGLQHTYDCIQHEGNTHYVLVGRADPRGTEEYNVALGSRRARAVQHYLVALGTGEHRLDVTSAGATGATGTDESGWARDRRVDTNRSGANEAAHP